MRIMLALLAAIAFVPPRSGLAQESSEPRAKARGGEFTALMQRLEAENWVPTYFKGSVQIFDPAEEDRRLREALAEPYTMVRAGRYEYRTSPLRIEEGSRLFLLFDFGTAEHWSEERYVFYATGAASAQDLRSRYGIQLDPLGRLCGIVGVPAPDNRLEFGWSCALCHAGIGPDGHVVPGAPNHAYDYGAMRYRAVMEHSPRPSNTGPETLDRGTPVRRLPEFGPGRHDVNGDRVVNPVKVPSLWGLRDLRSGIFANGGFDNIWFAMGAHNGGDYAASRYLEALVAYLLSLEPPVNPRVRGPAESRGEVAFQKAGCASCHVGAYYTNGEVIPIEVIGTDPERTRMEFPKGYRVPSLRRLDLVSLFLHDGAIKSLPDLFSRGRLPSVKGHAYGLDLSEEEKKELVAFLLSL